jgi:hypothetical protein
MNSIAEVKAAVLAGHTVHWHNASYQVLQSKDGEWLVVCVNGHVSPLKDDYNPAHFHIAL